MRRNAPRTFQLFGFPTEIRPGFGVFIFVLAFLYPFPLGVWVAGAVAGFTLIHELGHAIVARLNKCDASISLDFMVAYASYQSSTPLTWKQKIAIALSGAGLQVATAVVALIAFGFNPVSRSDIASSEVAAAVWWAGIALGVLNLIPLLPLDGGAVVSEVAERLFPQRGRRYVLQFSFGVTVVAAAATLMYGIIGLLPLFLFMLLMQWQQLTLARNLKHAFDHALLTPTGDAHLDAAILDAMLEVSQHTEALEYATAAYSKCPACSTAFSAAVAAHALGRLDLSVAWLRAAESSQIKENEFQRLLQHALQIQELWSSSLRGL